MDQRAPAESGPVFAERRLKESSLKGEERNDPSSKAHYKELEGTA